MQHCFPPLVLLWTRLCSSLHFPISDSFVASTDKYPYRELRGILCQSTSVPFQWGFQFWCMNLKHRKSVCPSTLLQGEDATHSPVGSKQIHVLCLGHITSWWVFSVVSGQQRLDWGQTKGGRDNLNDRDHLLSLALKKGWGGFPFLCRLQC